MELTNVVRFIQPCRGTKDKGLLLCVVGWVHISYMGTGDQCIFVGGVRFASTVRAPGMKVCCSVLWVGYILTIEVLGINVSCVGGWVIFASTVGAAGTKVCCVWRLVGSVSP